MLELLPKIRSICTCFLIDSSSSPNLSIPTLSYFYQFLFLLIFINSSISLFLSILPFPYFYQFLHFLIFINFFSSPNLSISSSPSYEKQISICFERKINRQCKCFVRSNDHFKSKNYILKLNIYVNINIIL